LKIIANSRIYLNDPALPDPHNSRRIKNKVDPLPDGGRDLRCVIHLATIAQRDGQTDGRADGVRHTARQTDEETDNGDQYVIPIQWGKYNN